MHIQINEKYRISGDDHNWNIEKHKKATEKCAESWRQIKHYGSLTGCVNELAELMLRTSDAQTLADALDTTKTICQELTRALSPQYEVILKDK